LQTFLFLDSAGESDKNAVENERRLRRNSLVIHRVIPIFHNVTVLFIFIWRNQRH